MLTPADAELVRRDPHLPGLALLLDAEAFSQRLVSFLPELHSRPLVCSYLRYKPGTNCLAAYRVESATGIGDANCPIQVQAKAFRSNADPKFLKEADEAEHSSNDPWGRIILRDPAVSIRIFPDDDRLPALNALFSPNRGRLLRKLIPESPQLWEAVPKVLRYKPERRCVLRLDGPSGSNTSVRCYAPREFAARDSDGFRSAGVLRIPKRLGRSRRHKLLVFEWIAGRPLDQFLSTGSASLMSRVGEALAELHLQDVHGLRFKTRRCEVRELSSIASVLDSLCPSLGRRCERLAQTLADKLLSQPPLAYPLHGDFYGEQVLVSGDKIVILDLDEAVFGDPAADLGSFIAHFDQQANAGRFRPEVAEFLARELLEGYRQTHSISPERVEIYRAAALLRLAPHSFRSRLANWPEQIEDIILRAETLLASLEPTSPQDRRGWISSIDPEIDIDDPFGIAQDPKLSFVTPALDPKHAAGQFRRMFPQLSNLQGTMSLRAIRVVRHKPGRRCLIEYDFGLSRDKEPVVELTLIGKVQAKRADLASYRIQQILFSNSFGPGSKDGVEVPEPLDFFPEWHMWLQRKVQGERATQLLETNQGTQLASRIAKAIYKLHGCPVSLRRRHTPQDELRILHERLPKVTRSRREWQKPIRRILDACDRLGEMLPEHPATLIHRDFYPDQVLVDQDRITLLDLDLCCAGDPALDIGNFHAHLTEQALRSSGCADALSAVQSAFVDYYTKLAGEESRSRIQAYATLSLVRHIYLSTLFPDRQHLTEPLMELSAESLNIRLKSGGFLSSSASKTNFTQNSPKELR